MNRNRFEIVENQGIWEDYLSLCGVTDIYFKYKYCSQWLSNEDILQMAVYHDEEGIIIYPFIKRQVPINLSKEIKYYDLTSPYGFSSILIRSETDHSNALKEFNKKFLEYCNSNRIISEFIRFHPFYSEVEILNQFYNVIPVGDTFYVDLTKNEEEIFNKFQHNNRKNIKRAKKENIEIEIISRDIKDIDEFYKIYYHTMIRNNAKGFYLFNQEFVRKMIRDLDNNVLLFNAKKDNKIISTELVLFSNDIGYSFLGGTLEEYFPLRPNNLLKYTIILKLKEMGLKYFYLGGGYKKNDGIYNYKKSFSPEYTKMFNIGKRIINKAIYDELTHEHMKNLAREDEIDIDYFPLYRC